MDNDMLRSLFSKYNLAHKISSNVQAKLLPPFRAIIVDTFKECLIEKDIIASAAQEIAEHMEQLKKKPYYSRIIPNSDGQLFHLVNYFPHYDDYYTGILSTLQYCLAVNHAVEDLCV